MKSTDDLELIKARLRLLEEQADLLDNTDVRKQAILQVVNDVKQREGL